MFLHDVATGQKEYNCAIQQGWQEPSPEWDLEVESSAIELICPTSTREEIAEIYWDMYQLWRSPGELPCDEEMDDLLCHETLDSIKEHLWHKQDTTLPGEEFSWCPTSTPRLTIAPRTMLTIDWFKDTMWGSCEEALAVARDANWQALVARALLEDKMDRVSHSLSHGCQCSGSHWHSGNHGCLGNYQWRSQTVGHQTRVPQVESHQGEPNRRKAQSPSPIEPRWQ